MKYVIIFLVLFASMSLCAEEGNNPAAFKEGTGLLLSEETKIFIGLETAEVEERSVPSDMHLIAQVYRESREPSQNQGEPTGFTYASAWISPTAADQLPPGTELAIEDHTEAESTVLRTDLTASASGGRVELLLQVRDEQHNWKIGEFIRFTPKGLMGAPVVVVPAAAVLETAYGPFVYVVNGKAYLRTAVVMGTRHDDTIEVVDGLFEGDEVVSHPVEMLYLTELRATKGGGHSH